MIEVYDIKDAEPEKLDITPELALAAYNTLIQFCKQQEASDDKMKFQQLAVEKMNPEYIGTSIELSLTPNHY